jgi:cyclophilin family peptidyl-prolyl cis-trans isomerase
MNSFVRGAQCLLPCPSALVRIFAILLFSIKGLGSWATEPNTIVRFEFVRGTNALGVADVELFDFEKPETVRNFLLYVRSGAYTNMFLHRLVPGFVLQGGGFAVTNPASADRFSNFLSVTNYGQLTNEYDVGPRRGNVYGTIAMAKLGNDPNSASSQWFFNLANNTTNLDNQNGGFTVFGRVLESVATNDGFNVLEHFNTLSTNSGIVNVNSLLGANYQAFNTLPVAYTNSTSRAPNYRELYFVRISVLNKPRPAGAMAPTIALTSPGPNSAFTNEIVRIKGTASDDVEVARVVYRLGDGPLQGAIGTTNWEVAIDSPLGFQTVNIQSIDWEGNFSAPLSVNYFYRRTIPLDLQIVGRGTVSGVSNEQILSANNTYTATAAPAAGNIFESWTGSITNSSATLTFQAPATGTNFTLIAKFITDPTPTLGGVYQGLLQPLGGTDFDAAGYMSLTNDSTGLFNGSLAYHGVTYYYTGKFDAEGSANVSGTVGGIGRTISLKLQKLSANGLITGTFSGTSSTTLIQLERIASTLPATNAPTPGSYTFVIPVNATAMASSTVPGGNGFGTATISATGRLTLSGKLGDGTTVSIGQSLTRLGRWPLYVNLDGGRGALFGWISHKTNAVAKLEGNLTWVRQSNGAAPFYPAGVTNQVNFAASHYIPPQPGERVLGLVHGLVRLTSTDLPNNFTNVVKLTTDNAFQVFDPNIGNLQLSLDTGSGRVSGSFVNPFFGTTHQINGAVLSASNYIRGQFISGSEIGSFSLDLAPFLVPRPIESVTLAALKEAMNEGGILQFQGDGIIVLDSALTPKFDARLDANGHSIKISGGGMTRLVETPTNITFSAVGIIFADGFHTGADGANGEAATAGGNGFGGGILSFGGSVALTNCVVTNCVVRGGNAGLDASTNSVGLSGGRAMGAALYTMGGGLVLHNCIVAGNVAIGGGNRGTNTAGAISQWDAMTLGGGIFSETNAVRIVDSTFVNNEAKGGEPLTLSTGGVARAGNAAGGAIALQAGNLELSNSKFLSNSVSAWTSASSGGSGHVHGGAVFMETNVTANVEKTWFISNSARAGKFGQTSEAANAEGGAIFNAGVLTLRDSALEQNGAYGGSTSPAGYARGGALASTGDVVINSTTFNENLAQGGQYENASATVAGGEGIGGAIFTANSFSATNSTFASNRAVGGFGSDANSPPGAGRGGAVASAGMAALANVTVAYNEAVPGTSGAAAGEAFGGGLFNFTGLLTLRSSIVASNAPANFSGSLTDNGYNISSDASYSLLNAGSLTNADPIISNLASNGGPTRTIAIFAESPAKDAVRGAFPLVDQRGATRPRGPFADSGAYEFVPTELSISLPDTFSVSVTVAGDPLKIHQLLTSTNLDAGAMWTSIGSQTLNGSGTASWIVPTTNEAPTFFRVLTR